MKLHNPRPYCCYCKRTLAPAMPEIGLSFTLDHVHAASSGSTRRVPCCRACNGLKGDLPAHDWFWFINSRKRWWKLYSRPDEVRYAVRQERTYRALNRLPQIGRTIH